MTKNSFVICLLLFAHSLFGQNSQHLYAFKNGSAFCIRKMQVQAPEGFYLLKEMPQATFGTMWFDAPSNAVRSVVSTQEDVSQSVAPTTLAQMLKANIGKKMTLVLQENAKSVEGTLVNLENNLLTFKTLQNNWLSLTADQVRMCEFHEQPNTSYEEKNKSKVLRIEFAKKAKEQSLEMMYLQKGISWAPNYLIDLSSETEAKLTLRAAVFNDVEDLENAQINFVVGVPNFAYDYLNSPLSSSEKGISFLQRLNNQSNQSYTHHGSVSRADISRQSMSNSYSVNFGSQEDDLPATSTAQEGEKAEDFFFYNAQNINLKKDGRAYYDVLQAVISYQHLYEVKLPSNQQNDYSRELSSQPHNEVWHSIRLTNNTKLPWTTGTALITKTIENIEKPLSQDKLSYTPIGGKQQIRLTIAPDISVKDSERELERKTDIKLKDGEYYDLVTVNARIEIKNYKDKEVKLNIERLITGTTVSCSHTWKVENIFSIYQGHNPQNKASWEVELKAGASTEINYQYKIYLPKIK